MRWLRSSTSRSSPQEIRKGIRTLFDGAGPLDEYTLPELAETLNVVPAAALVPVLADLTRENVVDQVFRVLSPAKQGGIDDFMSLSEVPDTIFDWRQDREINVEPRMVRLLFKKHSDSPRLENTAGETRR